MLESFAGAITHLTEAAAELSALSGLAEANKLLQGLQELPDPDGNQTQKQLLTQLGHLLVQGETQRAEVLGELNSDFSVPMKQFLRVDVAGIREMQDRLETARNAMEEAQLRYDIARSSKKKKTAVEKLSQELEHAKRQYGLVKMNLSSKMMEFEARQKYDSLERLLRFFRSYGAMFEGLQRGYTELSGAVETNLQQLNTRKQAWAEERSRLSVSDMLNDELELDINRQGYVEVASGAVGQSLGRSKKLWMVASQGTMYLYQSWKDESPKLQLELVVCSVRQEGDESFQLTSPSDVYLVKCSSASEAVVWMDVIRKSIQYGLKKLQEEKRRNDPNAPPDYLREMQMLSPENKLCADCAARLPEWASMTFGVLICDECSGVHRQLGTHLSRVRSLSIDMWHPEQYFVFKQFGNAFANPIWESGMSSDKAAKRLGGQKPAPNCSREDRDGFVRAKYVEKRWLAPLETRGQTLAEGLYDLSSRNDLAGLYRLLAHGADPALRLESGMSVFHQLVSDGQADVYTLHKLMLHSSDLHSKSMTGFDALHLAAHHNRALYCQFLVAQGFDPNSRSTSGLTPPDLAREAGATQALTFFETGKIPSPGEDAQRADELQKRATQLIDRIATKLSRQRAVLEMLGENESEKIFDIAKQIRMVKIGIQQIEKEWQGNEAS